MHLIYDSSVYHVGQYCSLNVSVALPIPLAFQLTVSLGENHQWLKSNTTVFFFDASSKNDRNNIFIISMHNYLKVFYYF